MSADGESGVFDAAAVQSALAHLNRCHQLENLRLARRGAASEQLHRAWLAGLDRAGLDFVAEAPAGPVGGPPLPPRRAGRGGSGHRGPQPIDGPAVTGGNRAGAAAA